MAEFEGIRAKLYKEAFRDFPNARKHDLEIMKKHLAPKPGEIILEVGAGNGLFSGTIADLIGNAGELIVSDPSSEQLDGVVELGKQNIKIVQSYAATLELEDNIVEAIWSYGAVHHTFYKTKMFQIFYKTLRPGGRVVIGDVFVGSALAKHFDDKVAKYCATGHEVTFLSKEYAETLCFLAGFKQPTFQDINALWEFNSKEDIGNFLYKLHAMTKTTPRECLAGAEEILGIIKQNNKYFLNWPMTMMLTSK